MFGIFIFFFCMSPLNPWWGSCGVGGGYSWGVGGRGVERTFSRGLVLMLLFKKVLFALISLLTHYIGNV